MILRKIVKIGIIFTCGLISGWALFVFSESPSNGKVRVHNRSGVTVSRLELSVGKNVFRVSTLINESILEILFPINGESGFKVKAFLASGKVLENEIGYVTRGINSSDEIVVLTNQIILSPQPP